MTLLQLDRELNADMLRLKYDTWGSHPIHPVEDWQHEVSNDETRLGYWEWVESRLDEDYCDDN